MPGSICLIPSTGTPGRTAHASRGSCIQRTSIDAARSLRALASAGADDPSAADWSVIGDTEADARQRLHDTTVQRMPTDLGSPWKTAAIRAHLDHGPIPGVYELTPEQNTRIDTSTDPEEELNRVLAEIDAARSA